MDFLNTERPLFALMQSPEQLAEAVLSIKSTTVSENRFKAHWQAKVQMIRNDSAGAVATLLQAITKYGPHIGLRLDLTTCYYFLGIPQLFEKSLLELKDDYPKIFDSLHPLIQARSSLMLGKLFEEAGWLSAACDVYSQISEKLEKEISNPIWILEYQNLYVRIAAQVLRFSSVYNYTADAKKHYGHLMLMKQKSLLPHGHDEVDHALFMYNLKIQPLAIERYFATQSAAMSPFIQHLCYYEMLEHKLSIGQRLSQINSNFQPSDCYDKIMVHLYNAQKEQAEALIKSSVTDLPKASLLRIFYIYNLSFSADKDTEIESLYFALLESLSAKDQTIWSRRLQPKQETTDQQLVVNDFKLNYNCGSYNKKIDLSRKTTLLKFVKCFLGQQSYSWQSLAEKIWLRDAETTDYDRMRMLIKRVNDIINPNQKSFELKDSNVVCNIAIKNEAA